MVKKTIRLKEFPGITVSLNKKGFWVARNAQRCVVYKSEDWVIMYKLLKNQLS